MKAGTARLTLEGVNTHTGPTTVMSGQLLLTASLSGSDVTVHDGALFGGTGTTDGTVTVNAGGIVAPGVSTGALQFGNVEMTTGAIFDVELNGPTPGDDHDILRVSDTVDLGGATLQADLGFAPPPGTRLTLISNDGTDAVIGTFADLLEGATLTLGEHDFIITYTGGDGNDVVLIANRPPVADAGGTYAVNEGGSLQLNASGTTDLDLPNDTLTYAWDLDNDGQYDDATGVAPTFSAASLDGPTRHGWPAVTDAAGEWDDSATVNILNVAQTVSVSLSDASISEDGSITLNGTFFDPGIVDTHTVVIDWNVNGPDEGTTTITTAGPNPAGTTLTDLGNGRWSVSATHQYLDDNPTGTLSDDYQIGVTVTDDEVSGLYDFTASALFETWIQGSGFGLPRLFPLGTPLQADSNSTQVFLTMPAAIHWLAITRIPVTFSMSLSVAKSMPQPVTPFPSKMIESGEAVHETTFASFLPGTNAITANGVQVAGVDTSTIHIDFNDFSSTAIANDSLPQHTCHLLIGSRMVCWIFVRRIVLSYGKPK